MLAHAEDPDGEPIVRAALAGIGALETGRRERYSDWLMVLSAVARNLVEEQMKANKYEYPMSDFARTHYGRGKVEGEAEGQARGKAESVLAVLSARRLPVSDVLRNRVMGCTDLAELDRWLLLSVHCADANALLEDPSSRADAH